MKKLFEKITKACVWDWFHGTTAIGHIKDYGKFN